jgi:beta-galactosidase
MKLGTYYYPDQWPRDQWERDFDRMASMKLLIVHMGEFTWATIEPREGDYRFDWLDECVEMAARRDMQVILATPTAVLPVWMVEKHPDILYSHERFGGRRHGCHTSPVLADYTRKVVRQLADRYGDHHAVIGWQIDNELSSTEFDQRPCTHEAFRHWLKARYGAIERLNQAWGTQFWNCFYTDWPQIQFPPNVSDYKCSPHYGLDAARFWSWSFAQYAGLQAGILRPKIGSRFITTNFMGFHPQCNPLDMIDSLDLYSWDSYPVTGWLKTPPTDENYRMGEPAWHSIVHDQMASYHRRWGLMELQPGTINWSGVPVRLYPGAVRLWIWTAFAHGAEFVTTYRFRQPIWGSELFHHGLIGTDGATPSAGGREFTQTIEELSRLRLDQVPSLREETVASEVGLLFDFDQLSYYQVLPQARRWDYGEFLLRWYGALMRLGLNVRIIHPGRAWADHLKMIIAPGVQMVDQALVRRFGDYAAAGGHLVLTCRTGLMNLNGQLWEGPAAEPILPLIGARIEAYDGLPDGATAHVDISGHGRHAWNVWADLLQPGEGTEVLARYADQFYAGAAAVTTRRHGRGRVTYSGVYADQPYHDALLEKLVPMAGLPCEPLPDRVCVYRRGPYTICLNYTDQAVAAPADSGVTFVVGSSRIDPAGVAVWQQT